MFLKVLFITFIALFCYVHVLYVHANVFTNGQFRQNINNGNIVKLLYLHLQDRHYYLVIYSLPNAMQKIQYRNFLVQHQFTHFTCIQDCYWKKMSRRGLPRASNATSVFNKNPNSKIVEIDKNCVMRTVQISIVLSVIVVQVGLVVYKLI